MKLEGLCKELEEGSETQNIGQDDCKEPTPIGLSRSCLYCAIWKLRKIGGRTVRGHHINKVGTEQKRQPRIIDR